VKPVLVSAIDVDSPGASLKTTVTTGGAPGLPAGLELTELQNNGGASPGSAGWTVSGRAMVGPGTYSIRVAVSDGTESRFTEFTLTVAPEDARSTYTGAIFVSTSSVSSSKATVTLSATVRDISLVDPSDPNPGDIRNATLTFVDRDTNTPIAAVPIGLVNPSDNRTGTAAYTWYIDIGSADSRSFTIGIVAGGHYVRNSAEDNTVVTVSKPLTASFITGGGYLVLANSAGLKAGDAGSKSNFGFNVKYNKSGKNLQGHMDIIVRRTDADGLHVYQVKGNAMSSMVTDAATGKATFTGKANIQDITNPLAPVSVDGNASLQVVMTDKGEPGSSDTIAITVLNKSGGLWFASRWDGTRAVEQTIGGGNLQVH
jgi:hypothetical protein